MGDKRSNNLKAIILLLLLLMAVSPHHYHIQALCCLRGDCSEQPVSKSCGTSQSGENVIIVDGEEAICPHFIAIIPLSLLCLVFFSPWRENDLTGLLYPFGKRSLFYHLGEIIDEFHLISFRFLRPPPASIF